MTFPGGPPEPDDIIGTEDERAGFEEFAQSGWLLTLALELTGGDRDRAQALLAGVLDRAWRRWPRLSAGGRDPAPQVRAMLIRAAAPRRSPPRRRLVALSCAAVLVAVAIAVPLLTRAAHRRAPVISVIGVPQPTQGIIGNGNASLPGPGSEPGPFPMAIGGLPPVSQTLSRDCQSANDGQIGSDWAAHSVDAGPVWFLYARDWGWPGSRVEPDGKLRIGALLIGVHQGYTALISLGRGAGGQVRFLTGGVGRSATLRAGRPNLSLSACQGPHRSWVVNRQSQLTMFWQPYVSSVHGDCAPVKVRVLPAGPAIPVELPGGDPCPLRFRH
jgi:hypothetical protein